MIEQWMIDNIVIHAGQNKIVPAGQHNVVYATWPAQRCSCWPTKHCPCWPTKDCPCWPTQQCLCCMTSCISWYQIVTVMFRCQYLQNYWMYANKTFTGWCYAKFKYILNPGHTAYDNDTITIPTISFAYWIHVSGHTATYRTSVTANMFISLSYRYRVQCDRGFTLFCCYICSFAMRMGHSGQIIELLHDVRVQKWIKLRLIDIFRQRRNKNIS